MHGGRRARGRPSGLAREQAVEVEVDIFAPGEKSNPEANIRPLAHGLHTFALLLLLVATTAYGHFHAAAIEVSQSRTAEYLSSIVLEWVLFGFVIAGIRRRREFLQNAFGRNGAGWAQALGVGFASYIAGNVAVALTSGLLYFTPLFHQRNTGVILALLPHTRLQFALWFAVSLSAGLSEEMIFRGYLQQQLTAWTKRPVLAIVLASILFGSVHLYEGLGAILPLIALALVYGSVARLMKGDLRAVIVAHTLQDFLIALVVFAKPFMDQYGPHTR